ncbi:MAG TPA: efflux RND transporter periplasmic adaptor subunit [Steroidobacteraceae bacterium]|jgi:membrane fusion protein (multidrug efflux system)|nr:efflux RND transporter periplasmic adaptor subunit [Steroidobacteraceae bacterium]
MSLTPENRFILSLLLGALSVLGGGCVRHAPPPPPKPAVTVVDLHARPVSLTTDLPGRVSAYRIAEVRPQVSGVLLKRLFKEGDLVAAGQQLYQIDPAPYEATLASARATLAHARASVTAAKLTAERYQALSEAHAVSRQDYDNAVATLLQDEADVASGAAVVRTAEINLAYTKVYSPISGRTGRSSVTEGALVTANQATSLLTVTQLDPVYVDLTQPSTTIVRLKRELAAGQIRRMDGNQAPAQLLLEDGSHYERSGTLEFSEVTVDQGTGSVTLRAIFPNSQELLLPGMFVRATIEEGVRDGAILAPQQGITHAPNGSATALVVDAYDKVEKRSVELDRAIGDQWVVTKGLAAGDRLIVGGLQSVKPGVQVAVRQQVAAHDPAPPRSGPALAAR